MIEIVPYRETWPGEFQDLAARLRSAAGAAFVAIHHIGSTAVPGLAAKDVIDLQITVADLNNRSDLAIETAGFEFIRDAADHCPPGRSLPPRELTKRFYKYAVRAANLHVREAGRFNQRYPLLCRDYLRMHRGAADAYGAIKQQLARYFPNDIEAYYAIKDPVFDAIMAGAEDWATNSGWLPPPGD